MGAGAGSERWEERLGASCCNLLVAPPSTALFTCIPLAPYVHQGISTRGGRRGPCCSAAGPSSSAAAAAACCLAAAAAAAEAAGSSASELCRPSAARLLLVLKEAATLP